MTTATTLSNLRKDRVTASRLPGVLGLSPFTKRSGVMREMVRQHFGDEVEFTGNIATNYGHEHEAEAIMEYALRNGVEVKKTGSDQETVVHPIYNFLAGTPDGILDDRVVEVKAPFKARYVSITERPDYETQARLQMELTGRTLADVVIWREGQAPTVDTIEQDPDWLPSVMPEVEQFMAEYNETILDPVLYQPHREPLKDERTDAAWLSQAAQWLELKYLIDKLTAELKTSEEELKALSPDKPARGGGVDLLRYARSGAVSYRKAFDSLVQKVTKAGMEVDIDLSTYRGKPSNVTSVRRAEAKEDTK